MGGWVQGFASEVTKVDFEQPRMFWEMLGKEEGEQRDLVSNICRHLRKAIPRVQREEVEVSGKISWEFAD